MSCAFTYLFRVESEVRMVHPVQSVRLSNCFCTRFGPTEVEHESFVLKYSLRSWERRVASLNIERTNRDGENVTELFPTNTH